MIKKEQTSYQKKMTENGFRKIIQRLTIMYCVKKGKKGYPAITHKIFKTNSCFHVK